MANRLARETSPYLLQHQNNPVDWYPWGDEALERARREDKPILLSVGYAACHWCHVMEHESFEDEATAALMNERFVCVKVDREERPDIDAVYMEAVQTMTGHGGWPMTVFLTPEGLPFYGGTYFPPEDRYGMPSFKRLLQAVAAAWNERRGEVEIQGKQLVAHLDVSHHFEPSNDIISEDLLRRAITGIETTFDPEFGGFGGAPKFPQPPTVDLLLRLAVRGYPPAREMATKTLDAMAAGGIFDQLGGGFHRYSVDRHWVVPHFEKMLYDNAQLLRSYVRSWLLTRNARHREVAEATVRWLFAEMRDPAGGFWSSLDADSEGIEGKFYVWSFEEVKEVTGADADAAIAHWGFAPEGNFEGHNIPVYARAPDDARAAERARRALLARRAERIRPETDTKVITSWNCLAVSALAEAGAALQQRSWVDAASQAMDFLIGTLSVDGRLMRSYRSGVVKHRGFCEDYAYLLEAALALYEATTEMRWLDTARWAADEAIRLFADPVRGGFFTTGSDAEKLVTRPKDFFDSPMAAANSVLALELQRLALITGEGRYEEHALKPIQSMQRVVERSPTAVGHLLSAIDFYVGDPLEIVIVGRPGSEDRNDLESAVRERFIPNKILIVADHDDGAVASLPLLQGRSVRNGKAAAYVCRRGVCKSPVARPEDLLAQLAG